MNPATSTTLPIRVSLCLRDPKRLAAWTQTMQGQGDFNVLPPVWDQRELIWAADVIVLGLDCIADWKKAVAGLDYVPALLVEQAKTQSAEEIVQALGTAPFAAIPFDSSWEEAMSWIRHAAAHNRMAYSHWYLCNKRPGGAEAKASVTGDTALSLDSLLSWLRDPGGDAEVCRLLGELFEKWSGSGRVLVLAFQGEHLREELVLRYLSGGQAASLQDWSWSRSEAWIAELEKHSGLVTASPQLFRWMQVFKVQYMAPLRHQDNFLGVLAFAERTDGTAFSQKDWQILSGVIAKMGQLLFLFKQIRTWPASVTGAPTPQRVQPVSPPSLSKEALRRQQLEIIGRMAMRSSHELKNCLVSIRTFTQLFPEKYADEQFRKDFYQVVSKEVERLNGLVEKLLFFAQPVQLKLSQEKITDLISEALSLFNPEEMAKVQLHKVFGHKQPTAWLDRQQMLAVFFGLIQNSLHASSAGGKLVIVTEDHPHPDFPEGVLVLRFLDTGRGMALKDPEEPFEPFYSTKARGMGLGLTIARRIVEEHGGTIRLESSKDKGTEAIICLPRKIPQWEAPAVAKDIAGGKAQ